MKEDRIVETLIQRYSDKDTRIDVEKHYSHYKKSGVVDLVVNNTDSRRVHTIEVKSDTAVQETTGANEILRQFNRHKEYFMDGIDHTQYTWSRGGDYYDLVFAATEQCLRHLRENRLIYNTVDQKPQTSIYVIHPDVRCRGFPIRDDALHSGWPGQERFGQELEWVDIPEGDPEVPNRNST